MHPALHSGGLCQLKHISLSVDLEVWSVGRQQETPTPNFKVALNVVLRSLPITLIL